MALHKFTTEIRGEASVVIDDAFPLSQELADWGLMTLEAEAAGSDFEELV